MPCSGPTYDATRRRFEQAFAEYGLPQRLRSDNGAPFAGAGLARLSRLNVWWDGGWGLCRNGLPWGIRSRVDPTSNFTAS